MGSPESDLSEFLLAALKDLKARGVDGFSAAPQSRADESQNKKGPSMPQNLNSPAVPDESQLRPATLDESDSLDALRNHIGDCQRCKLAPERNKLVFGVGNPQADLVFVGEAPGRDEDASGEPFVGRAGKLLTSIVEAIGLSREEIYICNVIKCRPPKNRNPESDEIETCEPFLKRQIQLIQPKVICTLGKFAVQCLLKTETPISKLRGHFAEYENVALMPTYHPAYLLRNPHAKKDVWEDMKQVHGLLSKLTGKTYSLKA